MREVCARKAVCRVRLSEFLLRRSRRAVDLRRVLDWACHHVRRDRRDAADIFLEVRLRDATAYRVAVQQDGFGQAQLRDENSEARRDVAAHRKAVHRGEPETFGPAEEDCWRVAVLPSLFLMPTPDFPLEPLRQVAETQEHPAARAPEASAELRDAAQTALLQVLLEPQAQSSLEPRVSQRVPEKADGLVDEQADERSSLKKKRAQARKAFQQDGPLGLQESHSLSRASP